MRHPLIADWQSYTKDRQLVVLVVHGNVVGYQHIVHDDRPGLSKGCKGTTSIAGVNPCNARGLASTEQHRVSNIETPGSNTRRRVDKDHMILGDLESRLFGIELHVHQVCFWLIVPEAVDLAVSSRLSQHLITELEMFHQDASPTHNMYRRVTREAIIFTCRVHDNATDWTCRILGASTWIQVRETVWTSPCTLRTTSSGTN
mmetsp:Transcript_13726/g.22716  ORF Transcript_13726/g.22716 Transcript_13726/m.22716 type:complete len:202 (-) Transcript_13726:923-1528(-)